MPGSMLIYRRVNYIYISLHQMLNLGHLMKYLRSLRMICWSLQLANCSENLGDPSLSLFFMEVGGHTGNTWKHHWFPRCFRVNPHFHWLYPHLFGLILICWRVKYFQVGTPTISCVDQIRNSNQIDFHEFSNITYWKIPHFIREFPIRNPIYRHFLHQPP